MEGSRMSGTQSVVQAGTQTVTHTVADSTPYPWPYDSVVNPSATALLICGGGAMWANGTPHDAAAQRRIEQLRAAFAVVDSLVIVIDHDPIFTAIDGVVEPAPPLCARPSELRVSAAGVDGFYGGPLDAVLQKRGITHLVVCGYGLETTVHGTVRRANDRGYECLTVIDAAVAHEAALAPAARSMIEMSGGIFGAIAETRETIAAFTSVPAELRAH
jgi:nicotinamidase-related amidase